MSEKKVGLSAQIRTIARRYHVEPAIRAGRQEFSIAVRDLLEEAKANGISTKQRVPPFCTSIQKDEFLEENGLEVSGVNGPPSGLSTTVVVHYRVVDANKIGPAKDVPLAESAQEKAIRLTERMRGLLKQELAEYGGGEAYLRWVRSEGKSSE